MNISLKNYSVRGLLIILVVVGHVLTKNPVFTGYRFLYLFIYTFHMPLFMILSGYYGYGVVKKTNWEVIKSTITSLVVPFIITSIAIRYFNHLIHGSDFNWNLLAKPSFALWFILALIFYRLTTKLIVKIPFYLGFVFIFSILSPYLPESIIGFAALSRIFAFMVYYFIGVKLRQIEFDLQKIHLSTRFIALVGIVIIGIISYLAYANYGPTGVYLRHDLDPLFTTLPVVQNVTYQVLTFLLTLTTCLFIYNLVRPSQFLANIGSKSFNIYLGHIFFITLLATDTYSKFIEGRNDLTVVAVEILIVSTIITIILTYTKFYEHFKIKFFTR